MEAATVDEVARPIIMCDVKRSRVTVFNGQILAELSLIASLCIGCGAPRLQALDGFWEGHVVRDGSEVPVTFSFVTERTMLRGSVTIPTLGAWRLPLSDLSLSGADVRFALPTDAGPARFQGSLRNGHLSGTWTLLGGESSLSATRAAAPSTRYREEDLTCWNGTVTLPGTLRVPLSPAPHPVVVFVHGSGPAKRDAFNYPAHEIAGIHIASFVFDKRGTGASTGD
jgi:hypothetical protein